MKFSKTHKIANVLSTTANGYGMECAELKGDRLYATNGRAMVVIPVDLDEGDVDGAVPRQALVEAVKAPAKASASVRANGSVIVDTKSGPLTMPRPDDLNFPNWDLIKSEASGDEITFKIGINAKLLLDLAKAMGSTDSVVTLTVHAKEGSGTTKPIAVDVRGSDASGFVMPVFMR